MVDTTPVRPATDGLGRLETDAPSTLCVAIYARRSTVKQEASIPDQIRVDMEWGERNGLIISPDDIYCDSQSGQMASRSAWQALREAVRSGQIDVVICHSQSRMFRDIQEAIEFRNEARQHGVRIVFAAEDTVLGDDELSQQGFEIRAVVDEGNARALANHVRTAQETLFLNGNVFGTITYGYRGNPVEGRPTRRNRPRCQYAVDETESHWVRTVFRWFGIEGWSIAKIVRELNRRGAPVRGTSRTRCWTRTIVRHMLGNPRYVGEWAYGDRKTVRVGRRYRRGVKRDQPLRTGHAEHLRIIDDVLWAKVQERLAAYERRAGRKSKDGDRRNRPRALNGFYICEKHDYPLIVCGHYGRYMECPQCKRDPEPTLVSMLPRKRALEMICQELSDAMCGNAETAEMVVQECCRAEEARQRPDVSELERLKRLDSKLTRRIKFIYDAAGGDDDDVAERMAQLRQTQAGRARVQRQIAETEAAADRKIELPSLEKVEGWMSDLCYTLRQAAASDRDDDAARLRELVGALTGGRIVVSQQGEPTPKKGWLRLTFRSQLLSHLLGHYGVRGGDDDSVEITIDLKRQPKHERIADEVKELADQGVSMAVIAKKFKAGSYTITRALRFWHESRGLEAPDYRKIRDRLKTVPVPPKYQRIAEEAAKLVEQPLHIHEIAERVGANRDTTAKAINWWREQHGQPKVDFRHRRKELTQKRRESEERQDGDADRSEAAG